MKPVDVTDRASKDLLAITDWLSNFSRASALNFIEDFEDAIGQLRQFPESGTPLGRYGPVGRRVLPVGVYDFIYEVRETHVVLRRVIDGRRLRRRL